MNGGFFVFSTEFFDYLKMGQEMIDEPFQRLIREGRLSTMRYAGFWSCMDTYKELQMLDEMYAKGNTPWALWNQPLAAIAETVKERLPATPPPAANLPASPLPSTDSRPNVSQASSAK